MRRRPRLALHWMPGTTTELCPYWLGLPRLWTRQCAVHVHLPVHPDPVDGHLRARGSRMSNSLTNPKATEGEWAQDDLRRAFVAGAQWWEIEIRGATMWQSDRDRAEAEAESRYPNGKVREWGMQNGKR